MSASGQSATAEKEVVRGTEELLPVALPVARTSACGFSTARLLSPITPWTTEAPLPVTCGALVLA